MTYNGYSTNGSRQTFDLLIKLGLLKLTLGYHIIWDIYTRDKVRAIIVLDNIMYMFTMLI